MSPIPQRRFQDYVQRFHELEAAGGLESARNRKWSRSEVAQELLGEDVLEHITIEQAEEMYRCLPISQSKRKDFLSNPLQEIRECLWFLLYEEAPYEIRVWESLDDMGGYRLSGGSQALVAALFCTNDPALFGLVNARVERALRILGVVPQFNRNESQAGRFQKLQEALWWVRSMAGLEDFRVADDFLEALAAGKLEGK